MGKKNLYIVGTVGLPSNYGGFETLAEHITMHLKNSFSITVFCSSKSYDQKINSYNGISLKYIPLKANGFQSIMYDMISILLSIGKNNIVLCLGVSGSFIFPLIKFFQPKMRIITNIDGIEWRRSKWNNFIKKILKFLEKIAIKYSDVIISDNQGIYNYVLEKYSKKSKVIAYGSDHVQSIHNESLINKYTFTKNKYYCTVARIEPENNIELILETFTRHTDLGDYVCVGNWKHSHYSKNLYSKYKNISNIILLDSIYDREEIDFIRGKAFAYIHGHSAGGTNPSLVEAMNLKLPIICYDVNFNRFTTENAGLYFCSIKSLYDILINKNNDQLFLKIKNELFEIGSKKYKWETIALQYKEIFEEVSE